MSPIVPHNVELREFEGNPQSKKRRSWKRWFAAILGATLALAAVATIFGPIRWTPRSGFRIRGAPGPSTILPRPEPLTDSEKELLGNWSWSSGMAGSTLVLAADGTFKESGGACFGSSSSQGTWKLEDRQLTLIRQSSYYRDHGEPGLPYWEADKRTDEFWVVRWGENRIQLVGASDMNQFVDDVNTNCERGQSGHARYSREGRNAGPTTGRPDLPNPWKGRLLPGEIRGTVLEILASGRIRANIGSRDGVKNGMLLFFGGGTKAYPVNLVVLSVTEAECTLAIKSNDQSLKVDVGSAISSHAFEFDAEGHMIDR